MGLMYQVCEMDVELRALVDEAIDRLVVVESILIDLAYSGSDDFPGYALLLSEQNKLYELLGDYAN